MKTYGDKFIVTYNLGSVRDYELAPGLTIEIAAEHNMDVRGNSEQMATIVCSPEGHEFLKSGDKVITHYLSSSPGNAFELDGETFYRVNIREIFAKINDDNTLTPLQDIYLCEDYVISSKTESGIYTTVDEDRREPMKLVVLNTPVSINKNWADDKINVGDIIMSQDDCQYRFKYNKKEYVKIEHKFIVGVFVNEETTA